MATGRLRRTIKMQKKWKKEKLFMNKKKTKRKKWHRKDT